MSRSPFAIFSYPNLQGSFSNSSFDKLGLPGTCYHHLEWLDPGKPVYERKPQINLLKVLTHSSLFFYCFFVYIVDGVSLNRSPDSL